MQSEDMMNQPKSPERAFPPPRRVFSAPITSQYGVKEVPDNSGLVETLYFHHDVKIISFSASAKEVQHSSESTREEAGTLPWSSPLERTIAVGPLKIYRAPGSVAFLNCGPVLQPILPKSQCWCIDESNTVFVLQVRRPNYWRIELPTSKDKSGQKGGALREVLDKILQFEKTWCPFQRAFFIDLPDEPSGTLKKKPWTPVTPASMDQGHAQDQAEAYRDIHHPFQAETTPSTILAEAGNPAMKASAWNEIEDFSGQRLFKDDATRPPMDSHPGAPGRLPSEADGFGGTGSRDPSPSFLAHSTVDKPATVADIVSDIDSRDSGVMGTADVITMKPDAVPSPNHLPTSQTSNTSPVPTSEMQKAYDDTSSPTLVSSVTRKRRTLPENTEAIDQHPLPANGASLVKHSSQAESEDSNWAHEPSQPPPTSPPHHPFASIKGKQVPHITDQGGLGIPRVPGAWVSTVDLGVALEEMPHAETIEISAPGSCSPNTDAGPSGSYSANAGPGHEITKPASLQFDSNSPRAYPLRMQYRSPFAAASKIPMVILTKTCEILLGPPSHLVELILKIAAKITAGEWRGQVDGVDENGQRIPIHWDYSDDELSGCDEDSYNRANQSNR